MSGSGAARAPGLHAIVPVKRFAGAKSRLAPVLGPASRARLARSMAAGVFAALAAQPDLVQVDVLSAEHADDLPLPRDPRFRVRPDPAADGDGLDPALGAALRSLVESGARAPLRLLYLAADLPCIDAEALRAWLSRRDANVAVAAALRDGGVNAMVWPLERGHELELHPGPHSAERVRARAESLGWQVSVERPHALAFDLDTPGDWSYLLAHRERAHPAVAATLADLPETRAQP